MKVSELFESPVTKMQMYGAIGRVTCMGDGYKKPYRVIDSKHTDSGLRDALKREVKKILGDDTGVYMP